MRRLLPYRDSRMFVLSAALGLSVVIALVGFSLKMSPQRMLAKPLTIFWRAVASFCGGCGLAILYNGTGGRCCGSA